MGDNVSGGRQPKIDKRQPPPRAKGIKSSDASVYKSSEEVIIDSKKSGIDSLHKSSEEYYEYNCDPCKDAGDNAEADGFCTDCKEYLCSTCFRSHSRSKLSKHHNILGREDMPIISPKVCSPCKTFDDIVTVVGYCEDCCDYLCEICYKNHPRNKLTKNHVLVKTIEAREYGVSNYISKMNIKDGTAGGVITKEEYVYVRDINVKSDLDEKKCYITGMTLVSNNELVICDRDNQCLKLVDIDRNVIKDIKPIGAVLNGITMISNGQIAVVLQNKYQIQIVTTCGKLTLDRTLKTEGKCVDIKMRNDRLYVSLWQPVKFQILQPTGVVIKTIKPDDEIIKHCTLPYHIAVSPDESVIYVSDWKTNKVLSLDMNGNMIALFQGEFDMPESIITSPSGFVYVCNREQHIVYKMTSDLSEAIVILGQRDGLKFPRAIYLDTSNQHFYISSACSNVKYCNVLKIYKKVPFV